MDKLAQSYKIVTQPWKIIRRNLKLMSKFMLNSMKEVHLKRPYTVRFQQYDVLEEAKLKRQ